ncbi:Crp/Fnr family transcriptional regulator [Paracidobacterium acidisoli]|uniref:Crp/Fnr family transcriptional regulator n=1 Tax=Paracidobacterium acidisoli TaxID=2303751 RepID=A0A372IJX2_9BACT|nr:Crp/Fnr family transcriptional regulator [Paracidobacterium acidisoli]MBT9333086.1 Crp/Fnr family transcriptional regulator [Paracidobacterium acidisoli]
MLLHHRLEVLARSALFESLPTEALSELAAGAVERRLEQGEILFSANDPSDGLYIVLSGSIRAFRVNLDGREQTIHIEQAGGTLAEVAVFDGGSYPSTTIAEVDAEVLFLAREEVRRFMLLHPEAALKALEILAKKLRMVASMVEQLALMDVSQRLAKFLLDEAKRGAPKLKDGMSFSLPLSHAQIAARLGSVREVVTRALQKLTQREVIEIRGHRIVVLSVKKLRDGADDRMTAE